MRGELECCASDVSIGGEFAAIDCTITRFSIGSTGLLAPPISGGVFSCGQCLCVMTALVFEAMLTIELAINWQLSGLGIAIPFVQSLIPVVSRVSNSGVVPISCDRRRRSAPCGANYWAISEAKVKDE